MITELISHRKGAVRYIFDNGNEVSIVFGAGTYTDNYDLDLDYWRNNEQVKSKTVEIMPNGHPAFVRWMERNYECYDVAGYVPVADIPKILKRADSRAYKAQKDTPSHEE